MLSNFQSHAPLRNLHSPSPKIYETDIKSDITAFEAAHIAIAIHCIGEHMIDGLEAYPHWDIIKRHFKEFQR